MKKVSVIIPTYNRASLLPTAINSALEQTYSNIEIIVVDDGSTEDIAAVVRQFPSDKVKLIQLPTNQGCSIARNRAIEEAEGEYIAFLDSDDTWPAEKTEKQVAKMEELSEEYALVYTGVKCISQETGEHIRDVAPQFRGEVFHDSLQITIAISNNVCLIRTAVLREIGGFDPELRCYEDYDLFIRIARNYKFDYIDSCYTNYFIHTGQISGKLTNYIHARKHMLEKYKDELQKLPDLHYTFIKRIGILSAIAKDYSEATKYLWRAIVNRPFAIKCYFHLSFLTLFRERYRKILERKCTTQLGDVTKYW